MISRRRIAVVTGTRAEYGLLRSSMEAVAADHRLQLQVVATGMHLLRKFGRTVDEIVADGWRVDARVAMQRGDDSPLDQAEGLARGVKGIAAFCERAGTDIVVVLGDRIEAMAGALAATATGRLLAHVHGGDLAPGDLDDRFRHAITKLADVHLVATKQSARRIIRMGESPERVHVVGAPGLDRLFALRRERMQKLRSHEATEAQGHGGAKAKSNEDRCGREGRFRSSDTRDSGLAGRHALVVYHPIGRAARMEERSMRSILDAVVGAGLTPTIIYPNSDRGHSGVVAAIEAFSKNGTNRVVVRRNKGRIGGRRARSAAVRVSDRTCSTTACVVRSLPRDDYLNLLMAVDVVVGNSSSGLIEAAAAGTPAVNVGPRQCGRQAVPRTVVHASDEPASIRAALAAALRRGPITQSASVYGNGTAGEAIAEVLATIPCAPEFQRKANTY